MISSIVFPVIILLLSILFGGYYLRNTRSAKKHHQSTSRNDALHQGMKSYYLNPPHTRNNAQNPAKLNGYTTTTPNNPVQGPITRHNDISHSTSNSLHHSRSHFPFESEKPHLQHFPQEGLKQAASLAASASHFPFSHQFPAHPDGFDVDRSTSTFPFNPNEHHNPQWEELFPNRTNNTQGITVPRSVPPRDDKRSTDHHLDREDDDFVQPFASNSQFQTPPPKADFFSAFTLETPQQSTIDFADLPNTRTMKTFEDESKNYETTGPFKSLYSQPPSAHTTTLLPSEDHISGVKHMHPLKSEADHSDTPDEEIGIPLKRSVKTNFYNDNGFSDDLATIDVPIESNQRQAPKSVAVLTNASSPSQPLQPSQPHQEQHQEQHQQQGPKPHHPKRHPNKIGRFRALVKDKVDEFKHYPHSSLFHHPHILKSLVEQVVATPLMQSLRSKLKQADFTTHNPQHPIQNHYEPSHKPTPSEKSSIALSELQYAPNHFLSQFSAIHETGFTPPRHVEVVPDSLHHSTQSSYDPNEPPLTIPSRVPLSPLTRPAVSLSTLYHSMTHKDNLHSTKHQNTESPTSPSPTLFHNLTASASSSPELSPLETPSLPHLKEQMIRFKTIDEYHHADDDGDDAKDNGASWLTKSQDSNQFYRNIEKKATIGETYLNDNGLTRATVIPSPMTFQKKLKEAAHQTILATQQLAQPILDTLTHSEPQS